MKSSTQPFISIFILFLISILTASGQETVENRWQIDSATSISWDIEEASKLPHSDNIEMAGKRVAGIVSYTINKEGILSLHRQVFFPQLHPFIKSTDPSWMVYRSYLKAELSDDMLPKLFMDKKQIIPGPVKKVSIDGIIRFEHHPSKSGIIFHRELFPSPSERLFVEQLSITNGSDKQLKIQTANTSFQIENMGAEGKYTIHVQSDAAPFIELLPGESYSFSSKIMAKKEDESFPEQTTEQTYQERQNFLDTMKTSLVLETPDNILNTLFEFSKIRASENIFESKLGLIHSPGGGRYYVGIWANDQAEYVSPFFPYLGYDIGNQSAMNCYRAFATEINPEFTKVRYAFEMEGTVPPFLLDRGDAAMIAYGASQFALASGKTKESNELWPLITWCLEYCNRQLNEEGVVQSESDEMEGRIETGSANLSTSSLYYGALIHTADLGRSLKKPKSIIKSYESQSKTLKEAIEDYFGANVEGLETYKYYKDHQYLRHWICLPLVVGIDDRKEGTITALFDRLWSENGVHVEKNSSNENISKIFWDRGTLYALRGTFLSGATEVSLQKLSQFSKERLLGERVPYVVEAYPEGNMAHLSAESGLYCRVFIEGMFGVVPTGLNSFTCIPRLPEGWDKMALRKIKAFGQDFDLEVSRLEGMTNIKIIDNRSGKILLNKKSSLKKPLPFSFK